MKPIVVAGSSNTDMVVKTAQLPVPGETILGGTFFMNPGGKGANQAVAAARLGGAVTFIGKTGTDIFGRQSVELFNKEGIDTSYLLADAEHPSGVALITVDAKGENSIVVAPGANAALMPDDLQKAQSCIEQAAIVLLQLEIPLTTVEYVAAVAASKGVPVLLNPAPACTLSNELLRNVSIITPNETEAALLSGIKITTLSDAQQAAQVIKNKGVNTVIITMGSKGALLLHEEIFTTIPAIPVNAIDTTAAGDVFNGALAVALSENKTLQHAVAFACKAAALSVTRLGAQSSAPYRREMDAF